MDSKVFIYNVENISTKIKGFSKINFYLYDKDNNKFVFSTSSMSDYNAKKYESDALKMLDYQSWFSLINSTYIKDFKPIIDDKNFIAGLICDNGILLRNEVQSKTIAKNNNQDYGLEM